MGAAVVVVVAIIFGFDIFIRKPLLSKRALVNLEILAIQKEQLQLSKRLNSTNAKSSEQTEIDAFFYEKDQSQDPSLQLQSAVAELANAHFVDTLLLGPFETKSESAYERVSIEFETEATYSRFLDFIGALERSNPPLFIEALQIRPIQSFDTDPEDVFIYARAIIVGLYK